MNKNNANFWLQNAKKLSFLSLLNVYYKELKTEKTKNGRNAKAEQTERKLTMIFFFR